MLRAAAMSLWVKDKAMENEQGNATGEGNSRMIKVLLYHRIVGDEAISRKNWMCVHTERFRRQMTLLERWGFTTITLNDYRLFLKGEINLPAKPVILTFDDGYLDTYENAFPILQELGMRAIVFAIGDRNIRTNYWDRATGMPEVPLMDGRQLVEMHEAGFEIGSHTMTHSSLTQVPEDRAWEEISRSRMVLEILLHDSVVSFAYPYGRVNEGVKRMVAHAGYESACGVVSGPAAFGTDVFDIRRMSIFNTTTAFRYALCLLTPYQYYAVLRRNIGHYVKSLRRSTPDIAPADPDPEAGKKQEDKMNYGSQVAGRHL